MIDKSWLDTLTHKGWKIHSTHTTESAAELMVDLLAHSQPLSDFWVLQNEDVDGQFAVVYDCPYCDTFPTT